MSEKFDLFKLYVPEKDKTPRKWICATGENLYKKLDEIINEILDKDNKKILYIRLNPSIMKQIYEKALYVAGRQQKLANEIDVSRQNLYKWKESKRRISYNIFLKILKIAGKDEYFIKNSIIEKSVLRRGISRDKIAKLISKRLNLKQSTTTEQITYKMRKYVPLIYISELLRFWKGSLNKSEKDIQNKKREIQETIEYLKQNSKAYRVIAVKELTISLAKIVGAMLADGCVVRNSNSISIIDEEKSNLDEFAKWTNETFGMLPKVRKVKDKNAWTIKIDNKVIRRYFITFFEFSEGEKKPNYDIPRIIKSSGFIFQKACASGVMCFDGFVRNRKEIGINIGSKNLRDTLYEIFKKDGIIVTKSNRPDSTGMWRIYSSGRFDKLQFRKWLEYFVKRSDKWFRICEWINGYSKSVNNIQETLSILNTCFSPKNNTKVEVSKLFQQFVKNRALTLKEVMDELRKNKIIINESTLWGYTSLLRDMKIIEKKRSSNNTNLYILNEKINEWRLPNRTISE